MRYRSKKQYSWNHDIAYLVGLITSDGSLSKDNRHIDFTSTDYQLARLFRDIVKPEIKIGKKNSGAGHWSYRVQFGDVAFYDFLIDVGLTPNKSLTLGQLSVPKEYFPDFLRGFFDGDGSIYGVVDRRWKNSYMFYITFSSASLEFLEWLQLVIEESLPAIGGCIRKPVKGIPQLAYAKRDSRLLHEFMYYKPELPCLLRKKQRFVEVFARDPYHVVESK